MFYTSYPWLVEWRTWRTKCSKMSKEDAFCVCVHWLRWCLLCQTLLMWFLPKVLSPPPKMAVSFFWVKDGVTYISPSLCSELYVYNFMCVCTVYVMFLFQIKTTDYFPFVKRHWLWLHMNSTAVLSLVVGYVQPVLYKVTHRSIRTCRRRHYWSRSWKMYATLRP